MPNQSITKFFRPSAANVRKEEVTVTPREPCKRPIEGGLTPDQKRRALQNKLDAKIRLCSNRHPGALHQNIGATWFAALESEFQKPYFSCLDTFVANQRSAYPGRIFPPADKVWSWTHYFDIKDTKVVILGQDPYHGPNQAHGLCFSVPKGVAPPPSLLNMYKELQSDTADFRPPSHGFLEAWARQGVLLLNACLTVKQGEANSHKDKGWEKLTDAVVKFINDNCCGVVFLLWGSFAQKKAASVDPKKHHLLKTVHPSPLSAHRGFFGCQHFSKCNQLLLQQGKSAIDWNCLD